MAPTDRDLRGGNSLRNTDSNSKHSRDLNESDSLSRNPKPKLSTYSSPQSCQSPLFFPAKPPRPESKPRESEAPLHPNPRVLSPSPSLSSSFSFSLRSKKNSYFRGKPREFISGYLSRKFSSSPHMARVSNLASTPHSPPLTPSGQNREDKVGKSKENLNGIDKNKEAPREEGKENDKEKGAVKNKFWKSIFSFKAPLTQRKFSGHSPKDSELPGSATWQEGIVANRFKKRTKWRKALYGDDLGSEGCKKEASSLLENKSKMTTSPSSPSSTFPVTAVTNEEAVGSHGHGKNCIKGGRGKFVPPTPLEVGDPPMVSRLTGEWSNGYVENGSMADYQNGDGTNFVNGNSYGSGNVGNGSGNGNGYGYGGENSYAEGFGNGLHGGKGDLSSGKKTTGREPPLMVQRPIFQPEEYVKRGRKDPSKRRSHRKSLSDGYISVEEGEGGGMVEEGFSHSPPHQFEGVLTRKEIEDVIFAVYQQKVAKAGREYSIPEVPSPPGSRGGRGDRGGRDGRGGIHAGSKEFYGNGGLGGKNKAMGVYGGSASFGVNGEMEVSPRIRVGPISPFSDKHKMTASLEDPSLAFSEQKVFRGGSGGVPRGDGRNGRGGRELFSELDGGADYERRSLRNMRRRKSHRESISDGYISPSEDDEEDDFVAIGDKYSFRNRHLTPSLPQSQARSRKGGRGEGGRGMGGNRGNEEIVIRASGNRVIKVAMNERAVDESETIEISCSPKSPPTIEFVRGEVEERKRRGRREKGQTSSKHSSPNQSSVPSSPHGVTPLGVVRAREVETSEDEGAGTVEGVKEVGLRGFGSKKGSMKRSQSDRLLSRQVEGEEDVYWRDSVPGEDSSASRIGGFSSSQDESSVSQSSLRRRERRRMYDGETRVRRKGRGRSKRAVIEEVERKEGSQAINGVTVGWQIGEGGDGVEEVEKVVEVPKTRNEKRKQLLEELRRWDWKEETEGTKKVQYQITERSEDTRKGE